MTNNTATRSLSQSKLIQPGAKGLVFKDQLTGGTDAQLYSFKLSHRSSFKATLNQLKANADLELIQDRNRNNRIDPGEIVASSRAAGRGQEGIKVKGLLAGNYVARVFSAGGDRTSFRLSISAQRTTETSYAYRVVQLTNTFRQQHRLLPLAINTQLSKAAQAHSQNMAFQDFFSHTAADGSQPLSRVKAAGYRYSAIAENIGAGYEAPKSVMQGWINSPSHRANLLNPNLQEIGVGYFRLANDTGTSNWNNYWAQKFATPIAAGL